MSFAAFRKYLQLAGINPLAIDGKPIGQTTPAPAAFTDVTVNTINGLPVTGSSLSTSETLAAIASTFHTGAIVKAIIYDTSKDSDGGAWRKRCSDKSWYNETIYGTWLGERTNESAARLVDGATTDDYYHNTTDGKFYKLNASSGQTEVFRGNVREFPEVALIVVELSKIVIYDATQPSLPMFMVFRVGGGFTSWTSNTISMIGSASSLSAIAAVNARLIVGLGANGFCEIDLLRDTSQIRTSAQRKRYSGNIAARNANSGYVADDLSISTIVNLTVNDVAACVLPDAPVDPVTGLPVPTIAVATDGGISVIHNNGTVVNSSFGSPFKHIGISKRNELIADLGSGSTGFSVARDISSLGASFSLTTAVYASTAIPSTKSDTVVCQSLFGLNGVAKGAASLLALVRENPSNIAKSTVAYITNAYNTGWMPGDIRGAWLSDSVAETLAESGELVTNGGFDSDTTGWTAGAGATLAVVSGELEITASGSAGPGAQQTITTVPGKVYRVSATMRRGTTTANVTLAAAGTGATTVTAVTSSTSNETVSLQFVAGSTTSTLISAYLSGTPTAGQTAYVDNISVEMVVPDRSVKGNGLIVNGSIDKTAVASGADLVAYSGFSADNYLEQPYSSNLDFGTGDFCVMGWFRSTGTSQGLISRRLADSTGPGLSLTLNADGKVTGTIASVTTATAANASNDGNWHHAVFMRSAGVLYTYVDGVLAASQSNTTNLTSDGAVLRVGRNAGVSSLALCRIGATAPSADQIRHIYETEKKLFEAGAKCLLDGTSTSVTALAYDENADTLHVGTSWGRSTFRDLLRVDSSATSVGSLTSLAGNQGAHITAGASGARYTQPSMRLRDELRRRDEARRALGKTPVNFDFDTIAFTGSTTNGSASVTSVSTTSGTPYVGMGITGSGIPAGTTIIAISGTTYTLSANATATATGVAMAQNTFTLPKGYTALGVRSGGDQKREGATKDYTLSYDGFSETVVFGTSPGSAVWVQVQATRRD